MTDRIEQVRDQVREKYAEIATSWACGCGPSCCGAADGLDLMGSAYEDVAGHVAEADLGLGCGLPVEHAGLQAGDTVLDLGSGAGNDVFVARHEIGDTGRAIGIDMTPETSPRRARTARSYPGLIIRVPALVGGHGLNCGCGV